MSTDVLIRLRGDVTDVVAKLGIAKANIASFASSATKNVGEFNRALAQSAEKREALNRIGTSFGLIGAAAAVGIGAVIKSAADFDQSVSRIAATGDDARKNLDGLREAAIKAGAATKFSATEAADGVTELLKAGTSAKDVLGGGLTAALNLASAGELDVASASQIMATAMADFKISGTDAAHVADLLAAAAGHAQGEVTDIAEAFKYVAPIAHQMGVSIEETTGTIAELARAGVQGSQAGTSLRGILSSLTSPSKAAADEMKKLGISVYDAQGNFVGFDGVAGQLQKHLGDLTNSQRDAALGTIFGNQQITAARILYQGGAADVDKWTRAVNDQGYAAETAATKMDNLAGDLEQLKGSLQTAFITSGEGAQGPLRSLVQDLTGLVNAYTALPGPVKSAGLAIAGITAAIGLSAFAVTRAVTAYTGFQGALVTLGPKTAQSEAQIAAGATGLNSKLLLARGGALGLGVGLQVLNSHIDDSHSTLKGLVSVASDTALGFSVGGPWGAAIGFGVGLLGQLGHSSQAATIGQKELADETDRLADSLNKVNGALTAQSLLEVAAAFQKISAANPGIFDEVGVSLTQLTEAATGSAPALAQINTQLDLAVSTAQQKLKSLQDAKAATTEPNAALDAEIAAAQQNYYKLVADAGAVRKAIDDQGGAVARAAQKWRDSTEAQKAAHAAAKTAIHDQGGAATALDDLAQKAAAAARGNREFGDSADSATGKVAAQVSAMEQLIQKAKGVAGAIHALVDPELGLAAATDAWKEGLRHLNDNLSQNTNRLKGNNDEAAKNRGEIRGQVSNILSLIDAEAKHGVSGPQMARDLQEMRKQLVQTGIDAGISKKDMQDYLAVLGLAPKDIRTLVEAATDKANADLDKTQGKMNELDGSHANPRVDASTSGAQAALDRVLAALNRLDGTVAHTYVTTTTDHVVSTSPSAKRASGGVFHGVGGPRDDRNLVAVSDGEFWVNARSTSKHLGLLNAINADKLAGGGIVGYANGGRTGPPGQSFGFDDLMRLIIRGDVPATFASVAKALADMRAEARDVTEAERDLKAARENARDATHRVNQTEKALSKTQEEISKERGKENVDLGTLATLQNKAARERERLKAQTKAQTQADKDQTKAEAELNRQKSQLTDAEQKLKAERDQLIQQAQAVADAVTATGAIFGGSGTSNTAQGLLAKLTGSVNEARRFDADIDILRRKGLDQSLIDQLLAEGPTAAGLQEAHDLAGSRMSVIRALNRKEDQLEALAARVGSKSVRERDHSRGRGGGRGDSIARGEGGYNHSVNFYGPVSSNDVDRLADQIAKRDRQALRVMRRG